MRMDRRAGIVALDTLYTWEKYEYVYEYAYEESSTTSTVYFYYPDPLYYYEQESNSTATATTIFYVGTSYSFNDSTGKFSVDQTTQIRINSSYVSTAIDKYYVVATSNSGSYSDTTLYHIIDASVSGALMTLTLEVFVSHSNKTYVGDSFSFDNITGNFTVDQTSPVYFTTTGVSNNVGKYYVEETIVSGTYTSSTIYHITACTYGIVQGNVRLTLTVAPLNSSITSNKIKGAYICDVKSNNLIKYPFNGPQGDYWYIFKYTAPFTYSGNSVSRGIYYMDSKYYEVYELTSSGTFTPTTPISNMGVWICGGGCGGTSGGYSGGAGAYVNSTTVNVRNPITITLGAGGVSSGGSGGTTSVEFSESPTISTLSAESGVAKDGGTGGGDGARGGGAGTGDGIDKHPFNSLLFNSYCDGGGGGNYEDSGGSHYDAGDGGTNGRNGTNDDYNGRGGGLYGGQGGVYDAGQAGIGYGSGGGGGSRDYDSKYHDYSGGSGYQGACFIRIPLSQGSYEYSLPEGYVKLDYVQSTAAQAVDTGVFMTNDPSMCIECEFSLDSVMESGYAAYMFGARINNSDAGEFTFKDSSGSFKVGSNGNFSSSFTLNTTSIYDVYMSTKLASFVDIKNTSTTYYASANSELSSSSYRPTLAIFCRHARSSSTADPVYDYKSRIKLYYFRVYDSSGLIRNFIPAKNSSNVAGLYDTVNGVFYTSVTDTNLIAGNVIS